MNFTALDFETANAQRASACSIALVVVRDNQITNEFYSLINPEVPFNFRNIQIHGITKNQVSQSPTFPEVWHHISPLFSDHRLVVAHNASFDNSVLRRSLERYRLDPTHYLTLDTLKTSKLFYPTATDHKLNTMCDLLNIDLHHHHNALDDSVACANILITQRAQFGEKALRDFVRTI